MAQTPGLGFSRRLAILRARPWQFRRADRPRRAATSGGRRIGSKAPRVNELPRVPSAEAAAPRVPDLQDVSRARGRAAPNAGSVAWIVPIRVAVDAMGGDRGPEEIVAGAHRGSHRRDSARDLRAADPRHPGARARRCSGRDRDARKPVEAVRAKPNSSLVAACRAVGEGEADAVVSAGNTGATLAAGLFHIRRLPEVDRPAIAVVIPPETARPCSLDSGANVDARPEHLLQFAQMGAIFAEEVLEIPKPGGAAPLDRRGAREGQPAHAGGARAPRRRERPRLRRQRREPRPAESAPATWSSVTASPATSASSSSRARSRPFSKGSARRSARRRAGRLGGLLIRPAARHLRDAPRPRHLRRRVPPRPARPAVIAHGNSSQNARSRTRSGWPRAVSTIASSTGSPSACGRPC